MKVAFVTDALHIWGAETSLLEYLRALGPSATALVHPNSPLLNGLEDGLGIEAAPMARRMVRDCGGLGKAGAQAPRDVLSWIWHAFKLAPKLRKFDVIICYGAWESVQVQLAAFIARRPCFVDLHETFRPGPQRRLLAWLARRSAGIVVPSKALAVDYGLQDLAVVIPRPVDVRSVTREDRSGGLRVCMLGQVVEHKRVLDVVHAVNAVDRADVLLDIYGAMPHETTEYQRAVMASSAPRATLRHRTSDVATALARTDALVNASEHEAFGRTVVEALQSGVWPIVCGQGGPREIVTDSGCGSLLDNPMDLAIELDRLASLSDASWKDAAIRCRVAGELYRSSQIVPRYVAFLRSAVTRDE